MKQFKVFFSVLILSVLCYTWVSAQATFKQQWNSKFSNKANFLTSVSSNGDQVIGTTRSEVCILNGKDGSTAWNAKLSDIAQVKKSDIQYYMESAGVLFVYDKKMGKDVMICIDTKTGKSLWENSEFEGVKLNSIIYMPELDGFAIVTKKGLVMVDVHTGKYRWYVDRFKGSIAYSNYDGNTGKLVMVNFKTGFGALLNGFENQLIQVDAKTGKVDWVSSYEGIVETKINTGEPLVSLDITEDKVILIMNGLEVFDRNTGKLLWKTHYDVSLNRGLGGSTQIYEAVADPLIVGNEVYVANFSSTSRKKVLQCFDLNTGSMKWQSDKIDGRKTIIPHLAKVGNSIVLQIGGYVNVQGTSQSNGQTTYYSKWKWQGPFGLQAFNADNGALLWESDKFKSRITNIATADNKIFVADDKYVYGINPQSGESKIKTSLKSAKTGPSMKVFINNDKVVSLCEKGICSFNVSDGNLAFGFKAKDTRMSSGFIGNNYFLRTEKMVVGLDLNSGKEKGRYKYAKGASWDTTSDGEYFFVLGKKGVTKYKVN